MVQLTLGTPAALTANRYQKPGSATPGSLMTDSAYVYVLPFVTCASRQAFSVGG